MDSYCTSIGQIKLAYRGVGPGMSMHFKGSTKDLLFSHCARSPDESYKLIMSPHTHTQNMKIKILSQYEIVIMNDEVTN